MERISTNFIIELFAGCLRNKDFLELCLDKVLFHHLPKESHKFIFKGIKNYYENLHQLPTIGILSQQFSTNEKVLQDLNLVKDCDVKDITGLTLQLQEYLKSSYFEEKYEDFVNLYNKGEKGKAYELILETGEFLANYSLIQSNSLVKSVFSGYKDRVIQKITLQNNQTQVDYSKVPFFIDAFDELSWGGCNRGDIWLGIGPSGYGKSKFIKWNGINSARIGIPSLHVQLEGTEQECIDLYDAGWTGQPLHELENNDIRLENQEKLYHITQQITSNRGEIYIYAPGKFDSTSLRDVRNVILELRKKGIIIGNLLLDYFNKLGKDTSKIKL